MLITSMGIFGFLSKAHSDQAITTGDVQAQVYLIDEQIKVERENIANAQSLIKQLDDAVVGINASGVDREFKLRDGTTRTQSAAERALQVRLSQARDRANLTAQIESSQTKILALQEKKAPIAANMREVEAKVGPIKYIAQLIYGDNPDENLLEKAVTWVIITIVFVFDPLAVLLLLASQMSFGWARQEKERENELVQETTSPEDTGKEAPATSEPDIGTADKGSREESQSDQKLQRNDDIEEANQKIAEIEKSQQVDQALYSIEQAREQQEKTALDEWNTMIAEAEAAADKEKELKTTSNSDQQQEELKADSETKIADTLVDHSDEEIIDLANPKLKAAMQSWKADHPEDSLKYQRYLYNSGVIDKLPWQDYLKPQADYESDPDAEEAAKWALEKLDEKKKGLSQ
jgi:multidrug efflux pump subunit AcrA (membrane-fusion protein)